MSSDQKTEFASARTKMLLTGATFAAPPLLLWAAAALFNPGGNSEIGGLFEIMLLLGFACFLAAGISLSADRLKARLDQR